MTAIVPREDKFKELLLYIAGRCEHDPSFGATKLNKVLFFSDFLAFSNLGEPVTGVEYFKLPYGPAPRRLLPLQQELVNNGDAAIKVGNLTSMTQKRLVALRPAKLDMFKPDEIALVDKVIDALDGATAVWVSELSHRLAVGWQVAADQETIPYSTVFLSQQDLTLEEQQVVKERLSELSLV